MSLGFRWQEGRRWVADGDGHGAVGLRDDGIVQPAVILLRWAVLAGQFGTFREQPLEKFTDRVGTTGQSVRRSTRQLTDNRHVSLLLLQKPVSIQCCSALLASSFLYFMGFSFDWKRWLGNRIETPPTERNPVCLKWRHELFLNGQYDDDVEKQLFLFRTSFGIQGTTGSNCIYDSFVYPI